MQQADSNTRCCGAAADPIVAEADLHTSAGQFAVAGLVIQLRTGMAENGAIRFLQEAAEQGYRALLYRPCGCSAPVAMAGFRILSTSRGRIVLLEDLVVSSAQRRHGIGAALVGRLHELAAAANCVRIELDTERSNLPAQRFYAMEGFQRFAAHFVSNVSPDSASSGP